MAENSDGLPGNTGVDGGRARDPGARRNPEAWDHHEERWATPDSEENILEDL